MDLTLNLVLSGVIGAFGVTGLIVAARRPLLGWSISIAIQPLWYTYYFITGGYLLMLLSTGYLYAAVRNLHVALQARGLTVTTMLTLAGTALSARLPSRKEPT